MYKKILATGIIFLFILSALTPMCVGYDAKTTEESIVMDNLDFYFYNEHGSYKASDYREYLKQGHSYDDVEPDIYTISVEPLVQILSFGPMDSAWPMKCHDLHHTSQSPYSTADNLGIEKWRFVAEGWIDGGIAIDNDGILYFGDKRDYIYAVYPNGIEKWRYKTAGWIWSSPAIAEDGTIYVGSWDTGLYALNPDGTLKWRVGTGGSITSSPIIDNDGIIYLGTMSSGNSIVAVNPNGTIKWFYNTGYSITGGPAIGDDGTIYCGSGDSYFYAINPDGTLRWRFKTGHYIKGPPSIAEDGIIYVGSYDDYLYALYPNGTMKWKCNIGTGTETNPSIAMDGTIYVGSPDGHLYAVNPDGTMKWSFSVKGNIHQSSPALSADGTIYCGSDDGGYIYAVNPNGTMKWRKKIAYQWIRSSPSISEDGTVYIGSVYNMAKGYLHAFGSQESNEPPERPTISGNQNGKIGEEYWYEIGAFDPDNNPISLYIEWGDGTNSGWTREQASGEIWYYEHTWSKPRTYYIKVKAKDVFDEESGLTEFKIKITIPRTKAYWLRFIDIFPTLQRFLSFIK